MEHTVEAYLRRQSTDVLKVVLRQYTESDEKLVANTNLVLIILDELNKREGCSNVTSPRQAWEQFLEFYADFDENE